LFSTLLGRHAEVVFVKNVLILVRDQQRRIAGIGDRQVSCWGSQADFLRVFSRVLGSMGLREVKVTGFYLRVASRSYLSGRCFRAFS